MPAVFQLADRAGPLLFFILANKHGARQEYTLDRECPLYITSTGVLPDSRGKRRGWTLKVWEIVYAQSGGL
jgi:hypothetical protein